MAEIDPNIPSTPQSPQPVSPEARAENPVPAPSAQPPHAPRASFWHIVKDIFIRVYSLILLLVVVGLSLYAFVTLLQTVFIPMPVPQRFLDWQGRVDAASLRDEKVVAVTGPAARSPLGHYHQIERWFQPDPLNGCTISGCHDPLPHQKQMKVPAFANFHTTFLACQMCHRNDGAKPAWVSTSTTATQDVPPLLQLLRFMETRNELVQTNPKEAHATIVPLLGHALAIAGNDASLRDLLLQFDTSEPGSPMWKRAYERATDELPLHARGEYGAKITREASRNAYRQSSADMRALATRYHAAPVNGEQRKSIHATIHSGLLTEPVTCISCHGATPSALDFEALGYSSRRVNVLGHLQLANLMQQIRQGRQFHIPKLLGDPNGQ